MAQKVVGYIKLQIPAGKATPAPPVYADRTFSFITKTPPAAVLIKKAINLESGSGVPNKTKVGKITREQLQKIAELKMPDLNAANIDTAISMIAGTARSMGVEVEG